MSTKVIEAIAGLFVKERVLRADAGMIHIPNITPKEAADILRKFADMVEKSGSITTQRLTVAPRGKSKDEILQAFTLWFGSKI